MSFYYSRYDDTDSPGDIEIAKEIEIDEAEVVLKNAVDVFGRFKDRTSYDDDRTLTRVFGCTYFEEVLEKTTSKMSNYMSLLNSEHGSLPNYIEMRKEYAENISKDFFNLRSLLVHYNRDSLYNLSDVFLFFVVVKLYKYREETCWRNSYHPRGNDVQWFEKSSSGNDNEPLTVQCMKTNRFDQAINFLRMLNKFPFESLLEDSRGNGVEPIPLKETIPSKKYNFLVERILNSKVKTIFEVKNVFEKTPEVHEFIEHNYYKGELGVFLWSVFGMNQGHPLILKMSPFSRNAILRTYYTGVYMCEQTIKIENLEGEKDVLFNKLSVRRLTEKGITDIAKKKNLPRYEIAQLNFEIRNCVSEKTDFCNFKETIQNFLVSDFYDSFYGENLPRYINIISNSLYFTSIFTEYKKGTYLYKKYIRKVVRNEEYNNYSSEDIVKYFSVIRKQTILNSIFRNSGLCEKLLKLEEAFGEKIELKDSSERLKMLRLEKTDEDIKYALENMSSWGKEEYIRNFLNDSDVKSRIMDLLDNSNIVGKEVVEFCIREFGLDAFAEKIMSIAPLKFVDTMLRVNDKIILKCNMSFFEQLCIETKDESLKYTDKKNMKEALDIIKGVEDLSPLHEMFTERSITSLLYKCSRVYSSLKSSVRHPKILVKIAFHLAFKNYINRMKERGEDYVDKTIRAFDTYKEYVRDCADVSDAEIIKYKQCVLGDVEFDFERRKIYVENYPKVFRIMQKYK